MVVVVVAVVVVAVVAIGGGCNGRTGPLRRGACAQRPCDGDRRTGVNVINIRIFRFTTTLSVFSIIFSICGKISLVRLV